jgi:hypothetical protein
MEGVALRERTAISAIARSHVAQNRDERWRYFFFAFFALFFAFFALFLAFFAAMMTLPFSALADLFFFGFSCFA